MNKFSQWIKSLQARINQLKTIGLKSSSSLGIYSKVVQIPDNVNYCWIVLNANEPMLFSAYIETPSQLSESEDSLYALRAATDESSRSIIIVRKGDVPVSGLSIRVVATSVFEYSLEIKS